MRNQLLPEFQKFLINRKLVPEKNVSFYAYWVSKFIVFLNNNKTMSKELRIEKFLAQLKTEKKASDWQVHQANESLQLYFDHFLKGDTTILHPNNPERQKNIFNLTQIIEKMREALRIKHYSYKTERSYIDWAKRFYYYMRNVKGNDFQTKPLQSDDVREFLSYLAINKRVSASTQNQAFNALLFLFRVILNIELTDLDKTVRAKRGVKLPVVLSIEEVQKLFKHIKNTEALMVQLLYGSGLRLMELARLRVKDIDFGSNLIFVRDGKGDKDRSTILPEAIKLPLQSHLEKAKLLHDEDLKSGHGDVYLPDALDRKYPNAGKEWYWQYVFPSLKLSVDPRSGKIRRHHISEKTIQNIVRNAAKKAGIDKHVTVHTLRHCFATHLLMNGVNIREVQELLGHKNVETTMIYTHVMRDMANAPKSPLDMLYKGKK